MIVKLADRPPCPDSERYALMAGCHLGLAIAAEDERGAAHHEAGAYECTRKAARAALLEFPELRG